MIKQISRLFRYAHCPNNYVHSSIATQKINQIDELSNQELESLLGRPLKESEKKQTTTSESQINIATSNKVSREAISITAELFYGLMPLVNEAFPICKDPDEVVLQETPNQNIFNSLALPKNCSFSEYTSALSKFRSEVDLYGDESEKSIIENNSLEFKELLHPESKYLEKARYSFLVNISIPGTIECEDPRNFMQLRPIEEFRHTPLIPISDSYMKKHQEMLERHHRKQFVFEVSQESIINWVLIAGCVGMASYLIYIIVKKEEERTVSFSRLKYQRVMGEEVEKPVFKI